jgi:hypothetical protein
MADVLITAAWLIILSFCVWIFRLFKLNGLPRYSAPVLLILKFACGIALSKMYMANHPDRSSADIFKFYDDSRVIYDALETEPLDFMKLVSGLDGNKPYYDKYYVKMKHWSRKYDHDQSRMTDTRLMIRLNALAMVFSTGVYEVHILFWCFLSLAGLCLIYRTFYHWLKERPWWLAGAVFLIPSVLCWGSGVLKEGLLLLFTGLLLYPVMSMVMGIWRIKHFVILVVALAGFMLLKVYILIAFIPAVVSLFIARRLQYKYLTLINLLVPALLILVLMNSYRFYPSFDVMQQMADIQQDMLRMAYYSGAGSVTEANPLAPTFMGFLRNLPEALLNATLRPSLLDVKNNLQLFAAIENSLIAIAILLCIGLFQPIREPEKRALVWFCLSFTFMLFSLTGLTTPVLGTLVRYRMPALPFLAIALILLSDTNRLLRIFKEIAWLEDD